MKLSFLCLLFLSGSFSMSAQNTATLASAGYTAPAAPTPVAPGQVITFFFRNVAPLPDGSLRTDQASTVPLPSLLGGLSAHFGNPPVSLPIFAVRQENDCQSERSNPACLLTALRVQIPTDLQPVMEVVLEVDGQASRSFSLTQNSDNAHVLTSCDLTWDTDWTHSCNRLVFHADGSQVTQRSPARPGETILVYAWGLGRTTPAVSAGTVSPSAAVVTQIPGFTGVHAKFLNGPRASLTAIPPELSQDDSSVPEAAIEFAGLTPGQIGLYQLNIAIPQSLAPTTTCGDAVLANEVLHISTPYAGTQEVGFCLKR